MLKIKMIYYNYVSWQNTTMLKHHAEPTLLETSDYCSIVFSTHAHNDILSLSSVNICLNLNLPRAFTSALTNSLPSAFRLRQIHAWISAIRHTLTVIYCRSFCLKNLKLSSRTYVLRAWALRYSFSFAFWLRRIYAPSLSNVCVLIWGWDQHCAVVT